MKPYHGGLVAVLTDARSFSRGEATTLILRALPTPARTFGEPTSGTDGAMTPPRRLAMPKGQWKQGIAVGDIASDRMRLLGGDADVFTKGGRRTKVTLEARHPPERER
ncbi:MAG: hypothetical protein KC621_21320 [Myxococcales bacterium]|nr:hypothetical protein [Myxococcales bacterium]